MAIAAMHVQIDKTRRQKISVQVDNIIRPSYWRADLHNLSRTNGDSKILADRVWENDARVDENHRRVKPAGSLSHCSGASMSAEKVADCKSLFPKPPLTHRALITGDHRRPLQERCPVRVGSSHPASDQVAFPIENAHHF